MESLETFKWTHFLEFAPYCSYHSDVNFASLDLEKTVLWYFHVLKQGFANFFGREPDREYFRLCGPKDLCCDDSFLLLWCESSIDNTLNFKEFQPCVGDLK